MIGTSSAVGIIESEVLGFSSDFAIWVRIFNAACGEKPFGVDNITDPFNTAGSQGM